MTNIERRRRIRESIATILACTLTHPKDASETRLLTLSKRLESQVQITIDPSVDWNWEMADEYFHGLACDAVDGRL